MPIKRRLAQVRATSTHCGNEEKIKIEQGDAEALNHMSADTLIDPEDMSSGSTHFSVTASNNVGNIDNDIDPADGYLTNADNVGNIDNDIDPAMGYLTNAEFDEDEDGDLGEEDEVDASFDLNDDELINNNKPMTLMGDAMEDDWDTPPPEGDVDEDNWDEPADDTESDIESDIADDTESEVENTHLPEAALPEDTAPAGEELAVLDVDGTDDLDTKDVAFASLGQRLMVIKANRIIATMTRKIAQASSREDIYLSDQFQQVTASELASKGLRKGLRSMGFVLAKVNVAKASVVNARVQLAASKTTAAMRKVQASKDEAFQQSLTIAAVGINRRYFNDQPNELKAHLESELQRAGLKGGYKLLQRAFASYGPAYAKSIVDLANKISAMPQESRDGFVSALDLTSEDMDAPEEDDDVAVGVAGDEADDNEEDEFEDDTVEATLATAGYARQKPKVSGQYSVTAQAILNGDRPLFG